MLKVLLLLCILLSFGVKADEQFNNVIHYGETVKISSCNEHQWCKVSDTDLHIQQYLIECDENKWCEIADKDLYIKGYFFGKIKEFAMMLNKVEQHVHYFIKTSGQGQQDEYEIAVLKNKNTVAKVVEELPKIAEDLPQIVESATEVVACPKVDLEPAKACIVADDTNQKASKYPKPKLKYVSFRIGKSESKFNFTNKQTAVKESELQAPGIVFGLSFGVQMFEHWWISANVDYNGTDGSLEFIDSYAILDYWLFTPDAKFNPHIGLVSGFSRVKILKIPDNVIANDSALDAIIMFNGVQIGFDYRLSEKWNFSVDYQIVNKPHKMYIGDTVVSAEDQTNIMFSAKRLF